MRRNCHDLRTRNYGDSKKVLYTTVHVRQRPGVISNEILSTNIALFLAHLDARLSERRTQDALELARRREMKRWGYSLGRMLTSPRHSNTVLYVALRIISHQPCSFPLLIQS